LDLSAPCHAEGNSPVRGEEHLMRKEYDFSRAVRNPYSAGAKKAVTIRLEPKTLAYFRILSTQTGLPYQTLINFYLRDCASSRRRLRWLPVKRRGHTNSRGR